MIRYAFRAEHGKVVLTIEGDGRDDGAMDITIGDAIAAKLFTAECIRAGREAAEQVPPRLVGGER